MRILTFLKILIRQIPSMWKVSNDWGWGVVWYSSSDEEDWIFKSNAIRDFLSSMKNQKQEVIDKPGTLNQRWININETN